MGRFNSASRLYEILKKADEYPPATQTSEVWSNVLGFDRNNKMEAFQCAVEFDALIKKVHADAASCAEDDAVELYTGALSSLVKLPPAVSAGGNWSGGKSIIDNGVLVSLKFCEELIAKSELAEMKLSEPQLDEFNSKVESLFDSVFYSSLPRPVKLSLIDKINDIKISIRRYHIRGVSGLENEVSAVIGSSCLHSKDLKAEPSWSDVQVKLNAVYGDFINLAHSVNIKFDLLSNMSDFIDKLSE